MIAETNGALRQDRWAIKTRLSAEFRNPSDSGFEDIDIPFHLNTSLIHEINRLLNKPLDKPVIQNRKEQNTMVTKTNSVGQGRHKIHSS